MNLYGQLFKYRGCANRNPLEDFCTEALSDLLNRDLQLARDYLEAVLPARSSDSIRHDIQASTQGPERIDLVVRWREVDRNLSLFVEHKVWTRPWIINTDEDENSKNPTNDCPTSSDDAVILDQIEKYCRHQNKKNKLLENPSHFVVLVAPYSISGFASDSNLRANLRPYGNEYRGIVTWKQIADVFKKKARDHIGDVTLRGSNKTVIRTAWRR